LIEPFEAAMNRLANDLVGLGQKSSFPYPSGQQFSFACPAGPERRVGFRAHFYYDEDEQSLHVFDVRVLPFF